MDRVHDGTGLRSRPPERLIDQVRLGLNIRDRAAVTGICDRARDWNGGRNQCPYGLAELVFSSLTLFHIS
jgi:hypothetical protein